MGHRGNSPFMPLADARSPLLPVRHKSQHAVGSSHVIDPIYQHHDSMEAAAHHAVEGCVGLAGWRTRHTHSMGRKIYTPSL
jgi:hypothetical protein